MSRREMGNEKYTDINNGGDASAPGRLHGRAELQDPGRHHCAVNHLLQLSMWHQLCLRVMKRKF